PRPGGSPARRKGARHRQHASEGRSRSRLRPRGRGRGGPPRHHRRAGAGARGVAGRSRHHRHEGLSVNLHEYQARDILRRQGIPVRQVLVAPAADIASESYVGIIVDRTSQRPVLMVSAAGGIDIEEVAAKTPEKIHRLPVDPRYGLLAHQALGLALKLYRDMAQARAAADIMQRLYAAFYAVGASLAEIHPLVKTRDGA